MSAFGEWQVDGGLPVFRDRAPVDGSHGADGVLIGNRRLSLFCTNDGTVRIWDEFDGLRWLAQLEPLATPTERTFHPAAFEVTYDDAEVLLVLPEGDSPWVWGRVSAPAAVRWRLTPRFVNLGGTDDRRAAVAAAAVEYRLDQLAHRVTATEVFTERAAQYRTPMFPQVFGEPRTLVFEVVGGAGSAVADDETHPTIELRGEAGPWWFRVGIEDGSRAPADMAAAAARIHDDLAARLPRAESPQVEALGREVPWHAAILTGGACADGVIGGHTLDQASTYSYALGFNGASRDPLQHALPLVYTEPDLALSVLRNTAAWCRPDGDIPYGLDGAKLPWTTMFQPSDCNLWGLWLAAEYAAATGDLDAFGAGLPYHPFWDTEPVSLAENLRRQFRFFVDEVGRGEHGHVRMRNADWNDAAIGESGVSHAEMTTKGESVLNSGFAAWVLPVWAGLAERIDLRDEADEARTIAEELRAAIQRDWTGQWFIRAWGGSKPVGDDVLWLEGQPWAILSGAATDEQARALLRTIDERCCAGSPLGARVKVPAVAEGAPMGPAGEGTNGGMWFAISMTLVWAAAKVDPALGWRELQRMTLASHTAAYPDIWEGTLSGPDAFNAPESPRPGHTWGSTMAFAMQAFPVNNLHSHAQVLLSYLRLLGVEPTARGTLAVGAATGSSWTSPTFAVAGDGHGRVEATGPVTVESAHGTTTGTGTVTF